MNFILRYTFTFTLLWLVTSFAQAQESKAEKTKKSEIETDSLFVLDSLSPISFKEASAKALKKSGKDEKRDSLSISGITAKRALIWSLVPGGGQIYNKKYWKLPIVYGLMGAGVYFISNNSINLRKYNTALDVRFGGGIDNYNGILSDDQLIANRNFYRRNVQLSVFGTVGIYGLSIMDAVVDAHLKPYDINENLSLKIKPKVLTVSNNSVPSLAISLIL